MATHSFKHTYKQDTRKGSDTFGQLIYTGSECRNDGCRDRAVFPAVPAVKAGV